VIPLSIKLKGFLCYREEQKIDFDGNTTLWMLSGLNGSGKSAIFDALTYGLFGHHRGGGTHSIELINKDCDGLLVELDFRLDHTVYRIKRTLRRKPNGGTSATQNVYRSEPRDDGSSSFVAIENTGNKRDGFDPWIRDNIGLDYDTFTSSVLLLQGKAEKLLDSRPEGRRTVLARIVDLERYERLHQLADEKRKQLEGQVKSLTNHLATLPQVKAEEIEAAQKEIAEAESAREESRKELERLQRLGFEAQKWQDLLKQLSQAQSRFQQAQRLLADAQDIETRFNRLTELREVIPWMERLCGERTTIHQSEGKTQELLHVREKQLEILAQRDSAIKQARDKRGRLQTQLGGEEERYRTLADQLRDSEVLATRLKELEHEEAALNQIRTELKELPEDPSAEVGRLESRMDQLKHLEGHIRSLTRFQNKRELVRQTSAQQQQAEKKQKEAMECGLKLAAETESPRGRCPEAAKALELANFQQATANTLLQQARSALAELDQLEGAKVCRHCGQQLTPGHLRDEKKRRQLELEVADQRAQRAAEEQRGARAAEQRLREQLGQQEKLLSEARGDYKGLVQQLQGLRTQVEQAQTDCAEAYDSLEPPFRARISTARPADWLATHYPSEDDLKSLRSELGANADVHAQLQRARKMQERWTGLKAQDNSSVQKLKRLQTDVPEDRQKVRAEHIRLKADKQSLDTSLQGLRSTLKEVEKDLDRLDKDRQLAQKQLSELEGQLTNETVKREHALRTANEALARLPAAWRTRAESAELIGSGAIFAWNSELAKLEQEPTEKRALELQQARAKVYDLQQSVNQLEADQKAFPEEARQDPALIGQQLAAVKGQEKEREHQLSTARQRRIELESRQQQREQLADKFLQVEHDHATQKLLADLLGRERLQLFLVRQAERQVVEYANAVLDRLSGGELFLKLSGEATGEGNDAKALALLVYNRQTGEVPINVAFLSGSQKFRVAVSLALGIGQYASKLHRPIESVIIDEGFGCLDRQGRQVMIQEMQNLRSQMRCILLVSHQEEFAEAFADGYHFELTEGATQVRRIQR